MGATNNGAAFLKTMRVLYVHEQFGAFGGAEANVLSTANGLQRRGHAVALAHGAATGRPGPSWGEVFATRFPKPSYRYSIVPPDEVTVVSRRRGSNP